MKRIKSLIFDMDGVLWRAQTPIGNLEDIFQQLKNNEIQYAFATNNSTRSPSDYQKKLSMFGIPSSKEQIITSAKTVAIMLTKKFPNGGPIYILGEKGLREALQEKGFYHRDHDVFAFVGGLDSLINYEKLKNALLVLHQDVEFYYTNADTTFPAPEGVIPGAGSILRALEAGCGRQAILAGKPKPNMFEYAMKVISANPESTLVIGDRLDTDILGGLNANCFTALVLSGISTQVDLDHTTYFPHLVFKDLSLVIDYLLQNNWEINA